MVYPCVNGIYRSVGLWKRHKWILKTIGPKMAYYAGWTYWTVHMPCISQKPNSVMIAGSAMFIMSILYIVMMIAAPLLILLGSADTEFIPEAMFKQNEYGAYTNGQKLVAVIVGILIIVPAIGMGNVDQRVKWLVHVNAVCMPIRYLWVFLLKKAADKFPAEYWDLG